MKYHTKTAIDIATITEKCKDLEYSLIELRNRLPYIEDDNLQEYLELTKESLKNTSKEIVEDIENLDI